MKLLSVSILMACSLGCLAQVPSYRNALSIEISKFGYQMPAGVYIQYDHTFKPSARGYWNAGAAMGGFGFSDTWNARSVRANVGYALGKQFNFLEFGLGGSSVFEYYAARAEGPAEKLHYYLGPQVGYKRIGPKGFQLRAYLGVYAGTNTFVGGGLGVGWAFGKRVTE